MKSRVIVCAIIEKDGMLLFGEKQKDIGPYPNTLHLICGGANLDCESIDDALKRENIIIIHISNINNILIYNILKSFVA